MPEDKAVKAKLPKRAIKATQEEGWASNVLNSAVKSANEELRRAIAARDSYLALLEFKYDATFDRQSGEFMPKEKEDKTNGG